VIGAKYVRLVRPEHSESLYPFQSGPTTNSSQVDADAPDHERFPSYAGAPFSDVLLQPGDVLYIPPKHWHYVKALSQSFSVSFWWR